MLKTHAKQAYQNTIKYRHSHRPFEIPITFFSLLIYFLVNFMTLLRFPTVHSDELWLKGIAGAAMRAQNLWVTEPFFDLYPRVPHPFRWLYVGLQSLYLRCFGDTVFAMRLLSLTFGMLSIIAFAYFLKQLKLPYQLPTLALMFNISFIYALHFGRQETMILFFMIVALGSTLTGATLWPALIVFLSIGVHPNSFLIAGAVSALMVWQIVNQKRSIRQLFYFAGILTLLFLCIVAVGSLAVPGFFSAYLKYGADLGLNSAPTRRTELFFWFWQKLYLRTGGTYDLMHIKLWLIAGALLLLSPLMTRKFTEAHAILFGTLLALFLLGRNNQLAVLFVIPWIILGITQYIYRKPREIHIFIREKNRLQAGRQRLTAIILLGVLIWHCYANLSLYERERPYQVRYDQMVASLKNVLPVDAVVLGNLNAIEAVDETHFYDLRNLGYLDAANISLEDYIRDRNIQYLIIHDEMNYIRQTSPTWDFLYVNTHYFDALFQFIETETEPVHTFENPLYAMRIAAYSGTYPWQTTVYKIHNSFYEHTDQ
ncbi:hypothetical protein KHM83_02600 [Fusibacter paucivorans]|uniref:Glycosyltransferase RgtA/B/C/D-like domain-containing protein n=1 Tax=Fusibacter paucivorans TaxID=76009 RepID=A0ABS5PK78_9FIRM|nr:hypothetical protein [Fusibacter paucivorans]MBS7525565.1 hypothetical protein [Fusibacter paucivorans]